MLGEVLLEASHHRTRDQDAALRPAGLGLLALSDLTVPLDGGRLHNDPGTQDVDLGPGQPDSLTPTQSPVPAHQHQGDVLRRHLRCQPLDLILSSEVAPNLGST